MTDEASTSKVENFWKEPEYKEEDFKNRLTTESSFSILYPKYREKYMQNNWADAEAFLKSHKIKGELDLIQGSMTVRTTIKTRDPMAILNARDFIKVVSRGFKFDVAKKCFDDNVAVDVIKIGGMVSNKERMVKRRQRLIGNDGSTLKAVELLTKCYIEVQGQTVTAMGPHQGLKEVRKLVEDTMNNVHPVYNIKSMMIKKELANNPALKNDSWDRFMPNFKQKRVNQKQSKKKKIIIKQKKEFAFPPPQPMSKLDKEMESGEYFLKEEDRKRKKREEERRKQVENVKDQTEKRNKSLRAPQEKKKKKNDDEDDEKVEDVNDVVERIKNIKKKKNKAQPSTSTSK